MPSNATVATRWTMPAFHCKPDQRLTQIVESVQEHLQNIANRLECEATQ
jgi:hypothetical protein